MPSLLYLLAEGIRDTTWPAAASNLGSCVFRTDLIATSVLLQIVVYPLSVLSGEVGIDKEEGGRGKRRGCWLCDRRRRKRQCTSTVIDDQDDDRTASPPSARGFAARDKPRAKDCGR